MIKKFMYLCLCWLVCLSVFTGCSRTNNCIQIISNDVSSTPTVTPLKQTIEITETKSKKYLQALNYIEEKHYPQAIGILRDLGDYKSSCNLLEQLRYIISGCYISNGQWGVGAITSTGGVAIAYDDESRYLAAKSWSNIKAITPHGGDSMESLTKDGKIVTTSHVTLDELLSSKVVSAYANAEVVKAVSSWENIICFQDRYPQSAVALTRDGSVYAAYSNSDNIDGTIPLAAWNNIIAVADGGCFVAGLKADGTVVANNYGNSGKLDVSAWTDIVAISAGDYLIGLKEDGTVLSTGYALGLSNWTDIIAISTDYGGCILGLKSDGTVVATGQDVFGKLKVSDWKDIVAIGIGNYFSIGLKSDGTMVLVGDCSYSGAKTPDVSKMKDLYIPQIKIEN